MKWFSNTQLSSDPIERAEQCADYLGRSGDLPEREGTAMVLLELVQNYKLPINIYRKIVALDNPTINFWIAMFGNEDAITAIIENKWIVNQYILNNVLTNDNLSEDHFPKLDRLIDDSPKGILNREIYEQRVI
jgi:hypothetical protein